MLELRTIKLSTPPLILTDKPAHPQPPPPPGNIDDLVEIQRSELPDNKANVNLEKANEALRLMTRTCDVARRHDNISGHDGIRDLNPTEHLVVFRSPGYDKTYQNTALDETDPALRRLEISTNDRDTAYESERYEYASNGTEHLIGYRAAAEPTLIYHFCSDNTVTMQRGD